MLVYESVSFGFAFNLILTYKPKPKAMKNFAKLSLSIMLLIVTITTKAQDSIYFKNKTIVIAKVREVGTSEIKYQMFENLSGPNYLVAKSDVQFIKYSNGYIDSIKTISASKAIDNLVVNKTVATEEIKLFGSRLVFHGKTISDRKLNMMIINHPSAETKIELRKQFKKMDNYKLKARALGPGLFVTGVIVHGYALGSLFGGNFNGSQDGTTEIVSAFIVGAALRISGHVVNAVYKNKVKSKRAEIVDMYNEMH